MLQTLPRVLLALFLLVNTAHAQQPDSLAAPASAPDSLDAARLRAGSLPAFTTVQPALSRVAGVQVTPYSGAPGAWATVRIRGFANVTGGSQPLYVVDGVPVYNTEVTPEEWGNTEVPIPGFLSRYGAVTPPYTPATNPLLDLPVEEVASVEVLKGAAATARYGMQGSNGVVLISTRAGADGANAPQPLRVRYAGWGGVQQVRQRYDLLSGRAYADLANVAEANAGRPPRYSPTDLRNLSEVDWQDRVFRVAGVQSHNLSVDGLARGTRYYAAADYLRQAGVVTGSGLSRYHLRANLDQQLTRRLRLGLKASASQADQRYAGSRFDAGPLLENALLARPAVLPGTPAPRFFNSPQFELDYFRGEPRTRRLLAQLSATYQLSDALSLRVRGSREQTDARALGYSPDSSPTPNAVETSTSTTVGHSSVLDAALEYRRTFGRQHALTGALAYLRQRFDRKLARREYYSFGGGSSLSSYEQSVKSNPIHSPSARLGYAYAGRYEVQASLRSDFAFNPAGKGDYHWFPGAQVSWHLHREAFLAEAAGLRDFTLWVGTGQTSTFFSPDRTTHHDAGLRLGVLDGKLTLEAGAYQRRTRHAQTLLRLPVPFTSPVEYIAVAFPDVVLLNRGLELTLTSAWEIGTMQGSTQVVAATNRNQVEGGLPAGSPSLPSRQGLEQGQPVGRFYVFEQDGTHPAGSPLAGQTRFRDRNNDGQVDFADGSYQGSGLPRYTLGFYQQLRLRRFQLETQLDGLFGYQLLNPALVWLDTPTGNFNSSARALGYWTPSRQDTSVPQPGSDVPFRLSDQALESGNHVRLSQLTFSYEVLNAGARRASVWVGGQNLFVTGAYRGFDPNVGSGGAAPLQAGQDASVYPVARVWQVGVRGQF
ncbi:TonB-dependent receptor plug domain-containing protein [Hymenobacter sp.]|uniref:TonB-dependent receptor plug domain-containing protein n=1 Tax=Hymenobacter sp. TaxID=1898978 RepID=UPI00286BC55D|nr:TonB-dependent receptor plug domain-containing protein [Hymenobacter sp.]